MIIKGIVAVIALIAAVMLIRGFAKVAKEFGVASTVLLFGSLVCYVWQYYRLVPLALDIWTSATSKWHPEETVTVTVSLFIPSMAMVVLLISSYIARHIYQTQIADNEDYDEEWYEEDDWDYDD